MNRLLMISYYFPPDGGAGTQRSAKFCKYLPEFGWHPLVITRLHSQRGRWNPEDRGLESDLGSTQVIRVSDTGSTSSWARSCPDIDIGKTWLDAAWEAISKIMDDHRPDAVLITMSPFDLSHLGPRLKAEFQVPIILDLRDPWALDGWRLHGSRKKWRLDREVMVRALCDAEGVIANTCEARLALLAAIPGLHPARVSSIPNGYDASDFSEAARPYTGSDEGRFRLLHAGTLHCGTLYKYEGLLGFLRSLRHFRPEPIVTSGRTPLHLLRAIRHLKRQSHPLGEAIVLTLLGQVDPALRRCISESGLDAQVELAGYCPHHETVERLCSADALFLPLHGLPRDRRSLIVPGKTYEYLASGRPILGCLPEGDARDLVAQSGRGFLANPCDEAQIADALIRLHESVRSREHAPVNERWLQRYDRRELTRRLSDFLVRTTGCGPVPKKHAPEPVSLN